MEYVACHVIGCHVRGCHLTQETRGPLDDVAGLVTGCHLRGCYLTQERGVKMRWMTWQASSQDAASEDTI